MADFNLEAVISAEYEKFNSAMQAAGRAAEEFSVNTQRAFAQASEANRAHMQRMAEDTEEESKKVSERLAEMQEGFKALIETLGLLEGLHIFKEQIAEALEMGERLKNMSTELGISTGHLQELQFAAAATGVDFGRLTQFVGQMTRALVTMSSGTSRNYQSVLAAAGLKPSDLEDSYTGIIKIGEAIQRLGQNSVQARALLTTFGGRGGLELAPMFAEMEELTAKAREMGLVLDDSVIQQLNHANEAFNVLGFVIQVDKERIAAALTPVLQDLATQLTSVAEKIGTLAAKGDLTRWASEAEAAIAGVVEWFAQLAQTIVSHNDIVGIVLAMGGAWAMMRGNIVAGAAAFTAGWELSGSAMDKNAPKIEAGLQKIIDKAEQTRRSALDAAYGLHTQIVQEGEDAKSPPGNPFQYTKPKTASQIHSEKEKELSDFAAEQALEVQISDATAQAKIAAAHAVFNKAVDLFTAQSKEAERAAAAELNARRQYVSQLEAQEATGTKNYADNQVALLNYQKGTLAQELATHQITKAQELEATQNLVSQQQTIMDGAYSKIADLYKDDPKQYAQAQQEKIRADIQFATQHQQIQTQILEENQKTTLNFATAWQNAFAQIGDYASKTFNILLSGTQNTTQQFLGMAQQLVEELIKTTITGALVGGPQNSLLGKLFGGGLAGLGGLTAQQGPGATTFGAIGGGTAALTSGIERMIGMQQESATAIHLLNTTTASGTLKSLAIATAHYGAFTAHAALTAGAWLIQHAGMVIHEGYLALIAAWTMLSATNPEILGNRFAAGGIVPSAARGMIADGHGTGIPSILHPKEMVLPAYLSEGFQKMLSNGETGGGDTHVHYSPQVSAMDARGVEGVLEKHADKIRELVMDSRRSGFVYRRSVA